MRDTHFLLLLVLWLALVANANAQSMMPLPNYGQTLSAAAVTRGFYFQAPRNFTIVGLRVPNEKNVLQQGVAVYVMTTPPPAWPATRTGGLWLAAGFFLASKIISCNVPINQNDWVGILGACGDRSIVHNSYAATAGPCSSNVAGVPVTIRGFGTQTNVMAAQGQGAYYAEDAGKVSRVEVYLNVAQASLTATGTGAPGTIMTFNLSASSDTGLPYQLGSALGNGPIVIGSRKLELSPDALLVLSVGGQVPTIFQNYAGVTPRCR